MSITCPVCNITAKYFIPTGTSYSVDTIGSHYYCVHENGLYFHESSQIYRDDFDSFHTVVTEE